MINHWFPSENWDIGIANNHPAYVYKPVNNFESLVLNLMMYSSTAVLATTSTRPWLECSPVRHILG